MKKQMINLICILMVVLLTCTVPIIAQERELSVMELEGYELPADFNAETMPTMFVIEAEPSVPGVDSYYAENEQYFSNDPVDPMFYFNNSRASTILNPTYNSKSGERPLIYCNYPEKIVASNLANANKMLFRQKFNGNARVFFSHRNTLGINKNLNYGIQLWNAGSNAITFKVNKIGIDVTSNAWH